MALHASPSGPRRSVSPRSAANEAKQLPIQLLEIEGPSVRAGAVAKRLGISPAVVEQMRLASQLLAVPADHGYLYPAWQFEGRGLLSGMLGVLRELALDPWLRLAFFLTPNSLLGGQRPLDLLRQGDQRAVLRAARAWEAPATA